MIKTLTNKKILMSFLNFLILTYNNLNSKLIFFLNSKVSFFTSGISILDNIFDYKKFYILFGTIYIYNKFLIRDKSIIRKKRIFEYYYFLAINFFFSASIVLFFKNITQAIRPFCKNILSNPEIINSITTNLHCNQSFPSGHTSFAIIFALITSKYCNTFYKNLLFLVVIMVSSSRVMIGAHSIIDILGAIIIGSIIVKINYKLFNKYSTYLYKKYEKYITIIL